jgi:four helix bundle protein
MDRLDHEKLDVYRCSLELLAAIHQILGQLPRGERELREQLGRAARSIAANIAEGAGKPTVADRARFHAIARGSAMECGAWLDICRVEGLVPDDALDGAKALIVRIVAMLTKMCWR